MKQQVQNNSGDTAAKPSQQQFFNKDSGQSFMQADSEAPFFQVQPKLTVNAPNDKYEQEADSMAEQVVQRINSDEESVQRSPLNVTPLGVQRSPALVQRMAEEEQLQASSDAPKADKMSSIESGINASKGNGSALSPSTREQMESGFGADFSGVNVHTGSDAVQMNQDLNANAFAHGNDVYFNEGQYQPDSAGGQKLLAHELTHTLQQGASVQRSMIQREDNDTATPADPTAVPAALGPSFTDPSTPSAGSINTATREITLPTFQVPRFKVDFGPRAGGSIPPLTGIEDNVDFEDQGEGAATTGGRVARSGAHLGAWEAAAVEQGQFATKLERQARRAGAPVLTFGGTAPIYYFKLKADNAGGVIFGTITELQRRLTRPYWNRAGRYQPHDVDHKKEIQLGGNETLPVNMWMLESRANRSSGSLIKGEKERRINAVRTAASGNISTPIPELREVKDNYTISFPNGVSRGLRVAGNPNQTWTLAQIREGEQLEGLRFLSEPEIERAGLRGSESKLMFYTRRTGGVPIQVPWTTGETRQDGLSIPLGSRTGGGATTINNIIYTPAEDFGGTGELNCTVVPDPSKPGKIAFTSQIAFPIEKLPGVQHGGYIRKGSIADALQRARPTFADLSPITFNNADLDTQSGLSAVGQILPTVPFFRDANIELVIDEEGIRIRRLFTATDLSMPPPFTVSQSSLEIFLGTQGLGFNGEVNFGINSLGEGFLRGGASTSGGFSLEGGFNFDTELFDRAEVTASFTKPIEGEGTWAVGGVLGISEGRIPGVNSAEITVNYSEGAISAEGTAELDVPGLSSVSLNASYAEDVFTVGGEFTLADDIPGIRSGSGSVQLTKNEEGAYEVAASGTAQPDIPGVDTELTINYDNGALTIEGTAAYDRGMLSGEVRVGASNRAIDEEGNPTGDPTDNFTVYGGGSLTLTLTPWLQATAGINFLPNGEIEVTGRIGLPDAVDLFDRRSFDRNLFRMPTVEIPIFAIPLGPRSIGIVARITGGLDLSAGFGPGQLRELSAEVSYNPDREDETTIQGRGEFVIPADAGLSLRGDLGIGASVAIASVSGGIEIVGSLGLEGEASAMVDVNWSPTTGLALDAEGRITVNPKFTFDINAFLRASLDLWLFEISETWRYNLASFSWGPDIQFGVVFPVHYREGEPFDMSFDDVEFIYPDINIQSIATGLGREVKDRLF